MTAGMVCTKCSVEKPMDCFNIRKDRGQPYRQCRDCMASRKWHKKNPERHREQNQRWVDENRNRAREVWREMNRRKFERNPAKRIHGRISNQIWCAIKRAKAGRSAFELVGYQFSDLRAHLERQFLRGMSWENMGEWHIDHIVPLSSFPITGPDDPELRRAWALSNLRPLWARDNIAKGAKQVALI